MGFKILDEKGSTISKLDMDIKDNPFYVICNINDINIMYSSFDKMMADKLHSISGTHIFRRVKDILDIYMIISDNDIKRENVMKILKYENRELGDFSTMLENKNLLKESYDKLQGINNKPKFQEIWDAIIEYLCREKFIK